MTKKPLVYYFMIFVVSLTMFSTNNNFMLGFHADEPVKVDEIISGSFNYYHPLLMVGITNLVVLILGINDPQIIAEVGRWLTALVAATGVTAMFALLSQRIKEETSLILTLVVSITPLLAIHAHYMKEDCWLFAFCAFALLTFVRLANAPNSAANILQLGLFLGLAISSKTAGAFLVPVFVIVILFEPRPRIVLLAKSLAFACILAVIVVVMINFSALLHPTRAWENFFYELHHSIHGHYDGVKYPFGFHITHSLYEGVGPFLLILAILGLTIQLSRWRKTNLLDRTMIIFALFYYILIEMSPLIAWPDTSRYTVPLVLPIAYFSGISVDQLVIWLRNWANCSPRTSFIIAQIVIIFALLPGTITGLRLIASLSRDTRILADRFLKDKSSQLLTEAYGTSFGFRARSLAELDLCHLDPSIRYLVASSFEYGRYEFAANTDSKYATQAAQVWKRYQVIFNIPYNELRPELHSYAFSNPTIRIIDLEAVDISETKKKLCRE
jgi:4-amino-4-deoxy-L-arabinose transferase-like glycosyltransferase